MTKAPDSFVHLNGNLLAAVDVETSGRRPGYHEVIQIAIQPFNSKLEPDPDIRPFTCFIKPEYPERWEPNAQAVHKIDLAWLLANGWDQFKVEDFLEEWFEQLELPPNKNLIPLAHNWQYEAGFLKAWFGVDQFHHFFNAQARDTMTNALMLNDIHYIHGMQVPFRRVKLEVLCSHYGIVNPNPHDALADALATGAVYKAQLLSTVKG